MANIRPVRSSDREEWRALWSGYLRFYRQHLPEEVTAATFARLIDERQQPHGLVAEHDGRLLGFVHYVFHPTTWSLQPSCYLEDLFVDPAARGAGVGRALIGAVYDSADRAQAATVYWLTQEFNAEGRALYDTLARRTSFIRYER
jgi:GNAT superfamily N-acetyltransferase